MLNNGKFDRIQNGRMDALYCGRMRKKQRKKDRID